MAVKIIGRDGQERKQGDTSSWSSPSTSSSSSSSSQQEQAAQQQTPVYSSTYQQQNQRLQSQIQAVEAERPKENTIVNPNLKERTITAFKEGYNAGQGKDYSLARLQAPATSAKEMLTYPLSEKANTLSSKIDAVQTTMLRSLPKGTAKDVITGVTNIPEMVVSTVGNTPLGLESIARNPTTISDSIALGTGALAGATVLKAKTHPGELAGEIIGAAVTGKAAGRIEAKTVNTEAFKSFTADEKATLSPKLIYKTKEPETVKAPEIETPKAAKPASINKISFADDVKLTPEMEEVLFGKRSTIEQPATELETRNIFSPEMTKASGYEIRSIEQKNEIGKVTISKDVKLTPEMEEVSFKKPSGTQKLTELETRDIFSPEMTKPSGYHISAIEPKNEISRATIPEISIGEIKTPRTRGVETAKTTQVSIFPTFAHSLPLIGQKISLLPATSAGITNSTLPKNKQDPTITNPDTYANINPSTQKTNPKTDPFQNTKIDPFQDTKIDPFNTPPINPDPFNYKPNPYDGGPSPTTPPSYPPITDITIIESKIIIPGRGSDFIRGFSGGQTTRRKTKHKTIQNAYGDPFKTEIKL